MAGEVDDSTRNTMMKSLRERRLHMMTKVVNDMQKPHPQGVHIREHKRSFAPNIPSCFHASEIIDWLEGNMSFIGRIEAMRFACLLCKEGFVFPVDRSYPLKDDSTFCSFQSPLFWPSVDSEPDSFHYAVYLLKRVMRDNRKNALEDYEAESYLELQSGLESRWKYIAEEAKAELARLRSLARLDKQLFDSQERAYWWCHHPSPGVHSIKDTHIKKAFKGENIVSLPDVKDLIVGQTAKSKKKNAKSSEVDVAFQEVQSLRRAVLLPRLKLSSALSSLVNRTQAYEPFDGFILSSGETSLSESRESLTINVFVSRTQSIWTNDDLSKKLFKDSLDERPRRIGSGPPVLMDPMRAFAICTPEHNAIWNLSLLDLLSEPVGASLFHQFMSREYCEENINFWLAVEGLRSYSLDTVKDAVVKLHEVFVSPNSQNEINVDASTREAAIKSVTTDPNYSTFSECQRAAFSLMSKGVYKRFLKAPEYIVSGNSMSMNQGSSSFDRLSVSSGRSIQKLSPSPSRLLRRFTANDK